MKRPEASETYAVIAIVVAALVVLALTPVFMLLDRGSDRQRPMYLDVETVAKLEYLQFKETGKGTAAVIEPGGSVTVDGHKFVPSEGVSMEVTVSSTGYCIRASNDHGESVKPQCHSGSADPGGSLSLIGS